MSKDYKHPILQQAIDNAKAAAISTRGVYPITPTTSTHFTNGSSLQEVIDKQYIDFAKLVIGSTFNFGKHQINEEEPWSIEWEIIHQTNDYQIARTTKMIDIRPFDAKEPSYPIDNDIRRYGNSDWAISNIEQWLNSDAAVGEWYSAQHEYDMPPANTHVTHSTEYDQRPGFLHFFTEEEKALLRDYTLTLYLSDAPDKTQYWTGKVFLPTITNLGYGNNKDIVEGDIFDKYNGIDNMEKVLGIHKNAMLNTKCTFNIKEEAWHYMTSSFVAGYSSGIYILNFNGEFIKNLPNTGFFGIAPCIALPKEGKIKIN